MPADPRIHGMLEEVLNSGISPEVVTRACPEMLPQLLAELQHVRAVEAQVDAMFPESGVSLESTREATWTTGELPRIPGYEIDSVLGRGGMGVVYKGRHLKLNRPVAIKMLLAGTCATAPERERFLREAEAAARLQHPNIVQVYDVGDYEDRLYFTMEFVDGGTLAEELAGVPQAPRKAAKLLATLSDAVRVAHEARIIHRDLKPSNILLTMDHTPKISDFGLARQLEGAAGLTLTGAPMGTPSYMSPEQARGDSHALGPYVDIYALGALLYELVTGRPPFHAESSSATLQQVISQEPVPPTRLNANVPRDLETICLKCLQKDPGERYVSATVLRDDVRRFLRNEPIIARPVSLPGRILRWARRNPTGAALGAAVLTLVALALAGAMSLELRQAERREETARQEEAVKAALRNSAALREQGRWPEARAALAVPQLPDSAAKNVVERLQRAQKDADMVAELEEIRLHMTAFTSDDPAAPALIKRYEDTFDRYGFPLMRLDVEEAAARLHASAIYETLLAFLHDWLSLTLQENRAHLLDVLDRADNDDWRRAFRQALVQKDADKLNELAHASESKDQPPLILSVLGNGMLMGQHRIAALALLQGAQQRHPGDFWINYLLGWFWSKERPREAVGYFRAAVAIRPQSDQAHLMLTQALRDSDDPEWAIAALRESIRSNPNFASAKDLITALVQKGRLEEACDAWENLLQHKPQNHEPWYGYAEFCLFLGKTDEYRGARRALLEHFGTTTNPFDAERTARACLLWPATEEELRSAIELAQRAVAVQEGDKWGEPYFEFVHGLAQYRQGQFDQAIAKMRGEATTVLGPAPRLVLAMALHRSGQAADARDMLAKAILAYDWRTIQMSVLDPNIWVYNVLRREAERMILPNLEAFMDGKYQPQDNDERFALLGACQFENRSRAMARLYADAFAATPSLADDLGADHRYNAARAAAQVGCGHGADRAAVGKEERTQWRAQARQWLKADLAARTSALETGSMATRGANRMALRRWQSEPDLAGLREPGELDRLAADERAECLALWAELAAVLARTRK